MSEAKLREVIRELSTVIGPRLGGSEASHRAREYLAEVLSDLELEVELQHFNYLGWEYEADPRLEVLAPAAEELDCAATGFSAASGGAIEGNVWLDGIVPVIPVVFDFTRFAVGDDGRRRASILAAPADGPPYPLPNVHRTFGEPTLYIAKEDGDRLQRYLAAGEQVRVRLETFGRHVPGFVDANVIGRLQGETEEKVLIGSHYDTAWKSPGAVDNASGVAAMIEVARRLKQRGTKRTFEFVSFAAEEWWLFGSEYFAEEALRRGEISSYRGMLNCDPLGPGDTLACWVGPDLLRGVTDQVLRQLGMYERYAVVFTEPHTGSDHYPFWIRGVPVCFPIFLPLPPEYHQPSDTLDIVDFTKLTAIVDIVEALAVALDRQTIREIDELVE